MIRMLSMSCQSRRFLSKLWKAVSIAPSDPKSGDTHSSRSQNDMRHCVGPKRPLWMLALVGSTAACHVESQISIHVAHMAMTPRKARMSAAPLIVSVIYFAFSGHEKGRCNKCHSLESDNPQL